VTLAAGIDVGGTKVFGVVVDDAGNVVREHRVPTPRGGSELIEAMAFVAEAIAPYDSLGVGVPGLVSRDGVLRASPNVVGIADLAVAERLGARLGHEVAVDNDATCAAAAEWKHGVAQGREHVIMVTLGTGIGGGIIADGRLTRGVNGFAGEIGHFVVDADGPPCPCGRRGCWERYASGSGLGWLGRQTALAGGFPAGVDLAGDAARIRGEHVREAAMQNDPDALAVIDRYGRWVALGLVNLTNTLDPEMFVLGGGLATDPELYLPPISRWFRELLYAPDLRPHPALAFAQLGERAGAIGAALLPALH
jgi:glucokinase